VAEKGPELVRLGGANYLATEPQLLRPDRAGYVFNAAQTAGMVPGLGTMAAGPSVAGVEQRLDALLSLVQSSRQVTAPANYTLVSDRPVQDVVSLELKRIKGLVNARGL
jgi:hypothetical protein